MVTCFLRYVVDPARIAEFEHYGKLWIRLVEKFGGEHHGYFLPSEGASNVALSMFTFPSLAAYEAYRGKSFLDPKCMAALEYAKETGCILSYERSFFRPVFAWKPLNGHESSRSSTTTGPRVKRVTRSYSAASN